MMTERDDPPGEDRGSTTLKEKLARLFDSVKDPTTGRLYSNPGAAAAIERMVVELPEAEQAGRRISQGYIWELREGRKTNPTMRHLQSLGALFGVGADYFLSEEKYREIGRQLDTLRTLDAAGVTQLALRATDLSPAGLAAVEAALEHARSVEGLRPADDDLAVPAKRKRTHGKA